MTQVIRQWFHRYFTDPEAVLLSSLLLVSFTILMTMSKILAPVLVSVVIAYLLEGVIKKLRRLQIPRYACVTLVYSLFMTFLIFIILILLPLLSQQLSQFVQELPKMMAKGQQLLVQLPARYPSYISVEQMEHLIKAVLAEVGNLGQIILSYSLASIPVIITVLVYSVLVPMLVFFFLKDKTMLLNWLVSFLPKERVVANKVWREMDAQMGNYVRGKVYEIFIVGIATYIPFVWMDLNYGLLLAVLVGLSVVVPYIGAVVVTIPVIFVAYFQWGMSSDFVWLITAYTIIEAIDGNILVPLLFSEAVNLHPVAIITAVLVFGGFWGFWGIFFAIPLATLVKALIVVWPRTPD